MSPLGAVLDLLETRPPTLGEGRLLCIDGPAGSGKSTLAQAVADAHRDGETVPSYRGLGLAW